MNDPLKWLRSQQEAYRAVGGSATAEHFKSAADEIERLRAFLRDRVMNGLLQKHGGYHGRRIHLEAKKFLAAEAKEE